MKTEAVYISRDKAGSNMVWVWRKPQRGNFKPVDIGDEVTNFQRPESMDEWDSCNAYYCKDFKKIFGFLPKINEIKKITANKKNLFNKNVVFKLK